MTHVAAPMSQPAGPVDHRACMATLVGGQGMHIMMCAMACSCPPPGMHAGNAYSLCAMPGYHCNGPGAQKAPST